MAHNKHPKRALARKMLTREERKTHTPVFDGQAWSDRKLAIEKRSIKSNGQDEAK